MAIKRTTQRQNLVRPSNIVPDSGGLAMAQASQNIANAITNITQTVDQSQLDNALLEAESQGIHLGNKTKDGKLVPLDLVSLNSAFKPDMYNKANLAKAQARFRKFAINAYGLNVQNDLKNYADNSFSKNQGAFNTEKSKTVVQMELETYSNTLKSSIAPEVWNNIQPTVNNIIGSYSRQASAEHLKNIKTKALITANKAMINLIDEKAKYILTESADDAGGGIPSVTNDHFDKEEQKLFEIFKANLSVGKFEEVKNLYKTSLQARVTKDAITAAHAFGIERSDLQLMVVAITEESDKTTIDVEAVRQEGNNTIKRLFDIDVAKKREETNFSTDLYNDFQEEIIKGNIPSRVDIDSSAMTQSHKNQINLIAKNEQISLDNKAKAIDKETNLQLISDIEIGNEKLRLQSTSLFQQRMKEQKVEGPEVRAFYKSWLSRTLTDLKDKQATLYSSYFAEMGMQSSYTISPAIFENQMEKLIQMDVIGETTHNKKPLMSVKSYMEKVQEYAKRYVTNTESKYDVKRKIKLLKSGDIGDRNDIKQIQDAKMLPKTISYKNELEPIDILHENPEIKEASLKVALQWTLDHNTLHPSLIDAFDALETIRDDKVFTDITMAYTRLNESFRLYDKENTLKLVLDKVGINPNVLYHARRYGMEWTNKMSEMNEDSVQRIYNDYKIKNESETDFVVRQFKTFLGSSNLLKDVLLKNHHLGRMYSMVTGDYGNTVKTQDQAKLLRDFMSQNGVNNIADTVIDDPRLMQLLTDGFWTYATNRNAIASGEKGMQDAMSLTLLKVFNQIGITKDGDGKMRWTFDPPLRQFQSTVPVDKFTGTSLPVTLTHDDMYNHIYDSINEMDIAWSKTDGFRQGHLDKNYQIVPNYNYGKEPTYTINVVNNGGTPRTIFNNYKFDWATSRNNKAWQDAVQNIEDNDFRKFVFGIPGMERQQVLAIYNRYLTNNDPDTAIRAMQDLYNRVVVKVLPIEQQENALINLSEKEASFKNTMLKTLGLDISLWLEN